MNITEPEAKPKLELEMHRIYLVKFCGEYCILARGDKECIRFTLIGNVIYESKEYYERDCEIIKEVTDEIQINLDVEL